MPLSFAAGHCCATRYLGQSEGDIMLRTGLWGFIGLSVFSMASHAASVATTGQISLIAPPASVVENNLVSDTVIFGFQESSGVTLLSDLAVSTIGPGTFQSPGAGG